MKRRRLTLLVVLLFALSLVLAACGGAGEETADDPDDTAVEQVDEGVEEVAEDTEDVVDEAAEDTEDVVDEAAEETEDAAEEVEEAGEEVAEEGEEAVEEAAEDTEEAAEEAGEEVAEEPEMEMVERPEGGLLIWADDQRAPILEEIGQQFTAENDVPIAIQQIGFGDIRDQFKLAAPAGEGPDIIVGAHDWLGELVINGLLAPIDLGDKAGDFTDPATQAFTYEGELYGMPILTENVAFIRNTDLVPDAPETWDDVLATCEALGDEVEQCLALMYPDAYHLFPIMTSYGGGVFGLDDEGSYDPTQVLLDSEGSIESARVLESMAAAGYVGPDVDWNTAHTLFTEGNAAFIITGPWAVADPLDSSGIPYEVSNIPAGTQPGQPFLGAQGFMVSNFSEELPLAEAFLVEYVATEEIMRELAVSRNSASAYAPVLEEQIAEGGRLAGFAAAGENAVPMPAIPEMAAVWTAWGDAETLIITQAEDAETAFRNAAEQIRTAIEEMQ